MKKDLLKILRCPKSGQELQLQNEVLSAGFFTNDGDSCCEVESGWLVTLDGQYRYPIHEHIPRFVPSSNYADNFGMQWNHFSKTQLDSYSKHPISSDRFWGATGWSVSGLRNSWVLDIGCGSGRFAEVALSAGAKVVALDYSSAVDACWDNLKHHPNLHVIQGDVFALPFLDYSFDFIYSLGVLQHTPDVSKAFASLPPKLRPSGGLCVDFYWKRFRTMAHMKYVLRPFTKRMNRDKLFRILEILVPYMLPLSSVLGRVPFVGKALKRLIPVANYTGVYPLSKRQIYEWALLDTFDWFAPHFDNPQSVNDVRGFFLSEGFNDFEIFHLGHLVGRGFKPGA